MLTYYALELRFRARSILSSMHPDKIKWLIIDGVYEAEDYRRARWGTNLVDIDTVADSFFTYCHRAGPDKYSLFEPSPERI